MDEKAVLRITYMLTALKKERTWLLTFDPCSCKEGVDVELVTTLHLTTTCLASA